MGAGNRDPVVKEYMSKPYELGAYELGARARAAGFAWTENPFQSNTHDALEWRRGFEGSPEPPVKPVDFTRATELTPEVDAAIDDAFEYYPWTKEQEEDGVLVRKMLATAIKLIIGHVPPCPDRTTAIRKIREARMDCNSAITHGGKY
jgi:hypothetical protein